MKKKFLIGTRGSELALAQTKIVKSLLESRFPDYEFEIKIIVTTGDKDLSTNWGSQGVSIKNFFTKEIEKELLEGDIDFAVHSMKDMPSILPSGLIMAGVPIREDNRDIFISKNSQKLMELPPNPIKIVKSLLESRFPDYEFEIKIIVTTGDKDLSTNWGSQGVSIKNFFTKEIEKELLEEDIDFAVHSMKDMPSILPNGLIMAGVPIREDNRDIFISKNSQKLMELPPNPIIGTSSLRRSQCIKQIRPDAIIKPLRGNIHTRIRKLYEEDYDGGQALLDVVNV